MTDDEDLQDLIQALEGATDTVRPVEPKPPVVMVEEDSTSPDDFFAANTDEERGAA